MNIKNNGGPAFPCQEMQHGPGNEPLWHGMSLRDYFAAKAMSGLINDYYKNTMEDQINNENLNKVTFKLIANTSYQIADAMMEARYK